MLIAYLAYKDQFAARMGTLVDRWIEFRMLRLHGERLADIVLTPAEAQPLAASPPLTQDASVEVVDLGFRYADSEPWVLRNCSFRIEAGESVAIVGASGCGKTTLLKLLLGLQQPTEGTVRIGGIDLQRLGPAQARAMFGVVMQDDQLFAGSIADNISFFDPDPDMARVHEAATLAAVHEDILDLPMGYHGLIGDMGSALSGGQKQRLILARALYRRPRFLFLDEATSHLDVGREQQVNAAVRRLKLTRVIIAHRPQTIASADRVLELAHGRIARSFLPPGGAGAAGGCRDRVDRPLRPAAARNCGPPFQACDCRHEPYRHCARQRREALQRAPQRPAAELPDAGDGVVELASARLPADRGRAEPGSQVPVLRRCLRAGRLTRPPCTA